MIRYNGMGREVVEREGYEAPQDNDFLIFEDTEKEKIETIDIGVWDGDYFFVAYPIIDEKDDDSFKAYIAELGLSSLQELYDNFPTIYENYRKGVK